MRRHHVRPGKIVIINIFMTWKEVIGGNRVFLFPMNTIIIVVVLRVFCD